MNTLFGILLIVCSVLYMVRAASWIYVTVSRERTNDFCDKHKMSPKALYIGGIEHLLYTVTLIGSAIILL